MRSVRPRQDTTSPGPHEREPAGRCGQAGGWPCAREDHRPRQALDEVCRGGPDCMLMASVAGKRRPAGLVRKSFFVDERALKRAKKILGVTTDAEVVRLSVERVAEMEALWRLMEKTRGSVPPGSFEAP